ncbi:MAG: ISAs1 family transposase, partial [Oligoflexia bacterium]|nr:ISAs1 family transposase [Oligoflexia bacterium]
MDKTSSILQNFSIINDPRIDRTKKHALIDIVVLSVCGIICSCESFAEIESFGKLKINFLKKFLELKNGIPSHDTIGRVLSIIDPKELQQAFFAWVKDNVDVLPGEIISLDGKFINSSYGSSENKSRSIFGMV